MIFSISDKLMFFVFRFSTLLFSAIICKQINFTAKNS